MTYIWVRIGDNGDSEGFFDLDRAVNYLNTLDVGQVVGWRGGGFDTENFWGEDYVRIFHGDSHGRLLSDLLSDERVVVEDKLQPVLN
jgi:hypothetical protein